MESFSPAVLTRGCGFETFMRVGRARSAAPVEKLPVTASLPMSATGKGEETTLSAIRALK